MTCKRFLCFLFFVVFALQLTHRIIDSRIRIIMIGAHPDDCDQDGGGTAILFAKMGYAVKFVSVTNGDAGHQASERERNWLNEDLLKHRRPEKDLV